MEEMEIVCPMEEIRRNFVAKRKKFAVISLKFADISVKFTEISLKFVKNFVEIHREPTSEAIPKQSPLLRRNWL